MKRSSFLARAAAAVVLSATAVTASRPAHAEATFESARGGLVLRGDAAVTVDFESAAALVGVEVTSWQNAGGFPTLLHERISAAGDIEQSLTAGGFDAVEGAHALRLEKGAGIALTDAAILEPLAGGKLDVTVWIRGDGTAPSVTLVYDADAANALSPFDAFAQTRAVRTGRQTDDGWAEYSTGPVDGSVWGAPLRGIAITPSPFADGSGSFLLDALEIRKLPGALLEPKACTQADVDATCGAEGDCMFGHCIPSTVTWGVLPAVAHRREIAERWALWSTRLMGDRNSVQKGRSILVPGARALAEEAQSSRQFFGGMARFVNLLRDNHTSFGSSVNFTVFSPQVQQGTSTAIGACFGVVEKDLLGGGLGYAVFAASDKPTSGVVLRVGDVLTSIDGQDPKAWVDANWPRFETTLPNDPASDWGASAVSLARLVVTRARSITLTRCASADSCDPGSRQTIDVPVGDVVYELLRGEREPGSPSFSCSARFKNGVAVVPEQTSAEDPIGTEVGQGGETRMQFDGFVGEGTWESTMTNVFGGGPAKVLVDARVGHGGYLSSLEHLFHLLRGTSEPIGVALLGRPTYDIEDPFGLFESLASCWTEESDLWRCFSGSGTGFFTSEPAPPAAATKIAWLNTVDVSANDFMPKLIQGRSGIRIFAPHPTSGAFGAVVQLPPVSSGWMGGSIQIQDARFAASPAEAATARWESGHGVAPDETVAQKLSDALRGKDTILAAAEAWLAAP